MNKWQKAHKCHDLENIKNGYMSTKQPTTAMISRISRIYEYQKYMNIRIYEQKTTDQRHDLKEFLFTSFAQLLHIVSACCEKILKSNQNIENKCSRIFRISKYSVAAHRLLLLRKNIEIKSKYWKQMFKNI